MKKGDKYVLEVHEVMKDKTGNEYARMKNFNALFFDRQGIDKLDKYEEPKFDVLAFDKGFKAGMEEGWALARVVVETTVSDLVAMGLNIDCDFEDTSEYGISCNVILSNTVDEIDEKLTAYTRKKQRSQSSLDELWDYIEKDVEAIPYLKGSKQYTREVARLAAEAYRFLND